MHDIRAIRENTDAFRAALSRRDPALADKVDEVLAHDAALRQAVSDKQAAETVRNQSSKLIGQAKAGGDEAEFERLRAEVAKAKETIEEAGGRAEIGLRHGVARAAGQAVFEDGGRDGVVDALFAGIEHAHDAFEGIELADHLRREIGLHELERLIDGAVVEAG